MNATLGSICATLLGLHRWAPDYDRLVTETEWQGGPHNGWVPLKKPVTYEYGHDVAEPIGSEVIMFLMTLAIGVWAWRNRHHKVDRIFARVVLGACVAGALYFIMLWLARQHVEGDWKAVQPRLMKYEVDTPEQLVKDAAFRAEIQQMEYKRKGLTSTGEKVWRKVCLYY